MIFKICAMGIFVALTAFLLREFGWRGVPVFCVVGFLAIISLASPYISEAVGVLSEISGAYGLSDTVRIVLKLVGIGYLSGITADICRELGQASAATAVSLVSRLEIIAISAPYFLKIIKLGTELIG